jgi:hypothetical protein
MSVVATLSGVLTVVIPAVVGLLLGNRLPVLSLARIVLGERWSRRQAAGMVVAGIAVLVIAMG